MPSFPVLNTYLAQRRADIQSELSALGVLETPRNALLQQSTASVTDQAVLSANSFTSGEAIRGTLSSLISDILSGAIEAGTGQTTTDSYNDFLNEALVLMGLTLKSSPADTVEGLLQIPSQTLLTDATSGLQFTAQALAILSNLRTQTLTQGQVLLPDDPIVDSVTKDLVQAKTAADRLLSNISAGVNPSLIQEIRSLLASAQTTLTFNVKNTSRIGDLATGLTSAGASLATLEKEIQAAKVGIAGFRAAYEAKFNGLASDRAQALGLSTSIKVLLDVITQAQESLPDLTGFRAEWAQQLTALLAVARDQHGRAGASVFGTSPTILVKYDGLVALLKEIPQTDLSQLTLSFTIINSLLTATILPPTAQLQFDSLVKTSIDLLTLYQNRLQATIDAVNKYPFASSDTLDNVKRIISDSKLTFAGESLAVGDVGAFLSSSLGDLNPIDRIQAEIKAFADTGLARGTNLVSQISTGFQTILDFEQDDVRADLGFEGSRKNAIQGLQDDLQALDRLQSLIDKASSL